MRPAPLARLVLAAHGSTDPRYQEFTERIAAAVRRRLPGVDVRLTYLAHLHPQLGDVGRPGDVVVPLLLSTGFHARVDIPRLVPDARVSEPLGPDRRLAIGCADRLRQIGRLRLDGRPVVLAAAGSSDPDAAAAVAETARQLSGLIDCAVRPAYVSAGTPQLETVVEGAGAVVGYLLAPGSFADTIAALATRAGVPVTAPLGDHPSVSEVIADRFAESRLATVSEAARVLSGQTA